MGMSEKRRIISGLYTWKSRGTDHYETPRWVVGCLAPFVQGCVQRGVVWDPFYCTGTNHWGSFSIPSVHRPQDFWTLDVVDMEKRNHVIVSCPPTPVLRRLFRERLCLLHKWAILVPSEQITRDFVNNQGHVQFLAINKKVHFELEGVPLKSKKMSMTWVLKGFGLPHDLLFTNDGHGY